MRQTIITIIIILFSTLLFAQKNPVLNKIWVANDLKCLDLRNEEKVYFDYGLYFSNSLKLVHSDSIIQLTWRRGPHIHDHNTKHEYLCYRIIKLTKDSLTIRPMNVNSKALLEVDYEKNSLKYQYGDSVILKESDLYFFKSRESQFDSHFKFNKLYFNSEGNNPSLPFIDPDWKIEIDKTGNILFYGSRNNIVSQFYSGKLSRKNLDSLQFILSTSLIDLLPEKAPILYDYIGPVYSIIISYNENTKKFIGYNFPGFNKPLLEFLLNIPDNTNLKKSKEQEFTLPNRG